MKHKILDYPAIKSAVIAIGLACTSSLSAQVLQYNASWSGLANGNSATATAIISIDTALIPNPGSYSGNIPSWFVAIDMIVQGATAGNGTFDISDFQTMIWNTADGTLNLTQELVGQATSNQPWATIGAFSGDFNVFAAGGSGAPIGSAQFQLTPAGTSEAMNLISFTPIPEPTSSLLVTLGVVILASRRRR